MSEQILMDLLSWLHGDKLREHWNQIIDMFDSGVDALNRSEIMNDSCPISRFGVSTLTNAMSQALDLKLYSLGIAHSPRIDLFAKIDFLVKAGIDPRSSAWQDLVAIRGFDAHGKGLSTKDLGSLRRQLAQFKEVLLKLQPTFGPIYPNGLLRRPGVI
jgi:hypothetical protein